MKSLSVSSVALVASLSLFGCTGNNGGTTGGGATNGGNTLANLEQQQAGAH